VTGEIEVLNKDLVIRHLDEVAGRSRDEPQARDGGAGARGRGCPSATLRVVPLAVPGSN
jgi:hypothetical protein